MNQPEPTSRSFTDLLTDIGRGGIKIPQFQRDFVWTIAQSAKLLDSIIKGYPIGTFIFWKTREQLRAVRDIGAIRLPDAPPGDFVEQVLDGQQRLTSLFAAGKGLTVERRDRRAEDFRDIVVDLDAPLSSDAQVVVAEAPGEPASGTTDGRWVRFVDLLTADFELLKSLSDARRERLRSYASAMQGYRFSIILLKEAPLDIATEVFTRINEGGKKLSVFEIMVAKTYDGPSGFDLGEKFRGLIARLREIEYETIPASAPLQLAALLVGAECKREQILRMDAAAFRENWTQVQDSIEHASEYLRTHVGATASRILPYGSLVVAFAYYFAKSDGRRPLGAHADWMREFFYRAAISGRYSRSLESNLAQDARRIDDLLSDREPKFAEAAPISAEMVAERGEFNTGRAFIKGVLCLLASRGPRAFDTGVLVRVDNDWLKQANSKNYHHFFPKAVLKKAGGYDEAKINHIANITIVDDFLNKRVIRAQPPKRYMKNFRRVNKKIDESMRSHLIDIERSGIWENDYDTFFRARCASIAAALRECVPERSVDRGHAPVGGEDADPEPESDAGELLDGFEAPGVEAAAAAMSDGMADDDG